MQHTICALLLHVHLTLDPCTRLLMQPLFSEENYATQFVVQRLTALFKGEQSLVIQTISKSLNSKWELRWCPQYFLVKICFIFKQFIAYMCPTLWLSTSCCVYMIHKVRWGRHQDAFAKKLFTIFFSTVRASPGQHPIVCIINIVKDIHSLC